MAFLADIGVSNAVSSGSESAILGDFSVFGGGGAGQSTATGKADATAAGSIGLIVLIVGVVAVGGFWILRKLLK